MYEYKTFKSSITELHNLINKAWNEKYKFAIAYSKEYLDWILTHPNIKKENLVAAYKCGTKKLLGFQLSIPLFYKGKSNYTFYLCTLLVTHPMHFNKKIAFHVTGENYIRSVKSSANALISFQQKEVMNVYKNKNHGMNHLNNYWVFFKIINKNNLYKTYPFNKSLIYKLFLFFKKSKIPNKIFPKNIKTLNKNKLDELYLFLKDSEKFKKIKRKWTKEEVSHEFLHPFIETLAYYDTNNKIKGIISSYVLEKLKDNKIKILIIDFIHIKKLTKKERWIFLSFMFLNSYKKNISIVTRVMKEKDVLKKTFKNNGFFQIPGFKYKSYIKKLRNIPQNVSDIEFPNW